MQRDQWFLLAPVARTSEQSAGRRVSSAVDGNSLPAQWCGQHSAPHHIRFHTRQLQARPCRARWPCMSVQHGHYHPQLLHPATCCRLGRHVWSGVYTSAYADEAAKGECHGFALQALGGSCYGHTCLSSFSFLWDTLFKAIFSHPKVWPNEAHHVTWMQLLWIFKSLLSSVEAYMQILTVSR